jgi:hypothetical protein
MQHTPKLFIKIKSGKIRFWQGFWFASHDAPELENCTLDATAPGYYFTKYGMLDGKLTQSAYHKVAGKNIGKKNATTPLQQAQSEIMSEFTFKKEKSGYVESVEKLSETLDIKDILQNKEWRVNVMLLHDYKKFKNKIKFPCAVQPKYDGTHCVVFYHPEIGVDVYMRGKTDGAAQIHIKSAFECLDESFAGIYVTGELWKFGLSRQTISSMSNKEKASDVDILLDLNIFDVFYLDKKLDFEQRWDEARRLCEFLRKNSSEKSSKSNEKSSKAVGKLCAKYVKLSETRIVQNEMELEDYFQSQVKIGMEGIVVRSLRGIYQYSFYNPIRSFEVMKYKNRQDCEYEIVGVKGGKGKMAGCAIFLLKTESGKQFSAVAPGDLEVKKKYFVDAQKYIGVMATVQFDDLSDEGVPIQPVIVEIPPI